MTRKSTGLPPFVRLALMAMPLPAQATPIPAPPAINATAWILMEAHTGFVLGEKNPTKYRSARKPGARLARGCLSR